MAVMVALAQADQPALAQAGTGGRVRGMSLLLDALWTDARHELWRQHYTGRITGTTGSAGRSRAVRSARMDAEALHSQLAIAVHRLLKGPPSLGAAAVTVL